MSSPYFEQYQGQYPVIDLSFKGVKALNFDDSLADIQRLIQMECQQHAYLRTSKHLSNLQKTDFEHYILEKQLILYGETPLRIYLAIYTTSSTSSHYLNR